MYQNCAHLGRIRKERYGMFSGEKSQMETECVNTHGLSLRIKILWISQDFAEILMQNLG